MAIDESTNINNIVAMTIVLIVSWLVIWRNREQIVALRESPRNYGAHLGRGARFSKVPVTLRARNQIFKSK